mgnify:FL=1
MKRFCFIISIIILVSTSLFSQSPQQRRLEDIILEQSRQNNNLLMPTGENKYITSEDGTIRMYVNVWGAVANPGVHLVYEDIDILTLLTVSGGPIEGADLSEVKVIREINDSSKSNILKLNIKKFLKRGSRKDIISLKPNDTIIVPESLSYKIFSRSNWINTTLHIITLYFQLEFYRSRID